MPTEWLLRAMALEDFAKPPITQWTRALSAGRNSCNIPHSAWEAKYEID